MINEKTDLDALREQAYREGMKPLRISGAMKVRPASPPSTK